MAGRSRYSGRVTTPTDHAGVDAAVHEDRGRIWLPFLLSLALLVVTVVWGWLVYTDLPAMIPTGFDADGEVRGWAEKNIGSVFTSVFFATGTLAMLWLIGVMVPVMSRAPKGISVWQRLRVEYAQRATTEFLGWTAALMTLMQCGIAVESWSIQHSFRGWSLWLIVLVLVGIFVIMVPIYRCHRGWTDRTAERLGIHPTEEEAAEDELWLPMGLYNNPDDPAVMVPKRVGYGVGSTVNIGSRGGKISVAVFVLVTLGSIGLILVPLLTT